MSTKHLQLDIIFLDMYIYTEKIKLKRTLIIDYTYIYVTYMYVLLMLWSFRWLIYNYFIHSNFLIFRIRGFIVRSFHLSGGAQYCIVVVWIHFKRNVPWLQFKPVIQLVVAARVVGIGAHSFSEMFGRSMENV